MQTNVISFPRAGWLGSRIKAATVRHFTLSISRRTATPRNASQRAAPQRNATLLKATPQMLQAVKDKFRK